MAQTTRKKLTIRPRVARMNQILERGVNHTVRALDGVSGRLGLGGRKADYDDLRYEFKGGPSEELRKRHYDKSLRLLWKAEVEAPWTSFRDASKAEKAVVEQAIRALTPEEKAARDRINSQEFRDFLNAQYTPEEKKALVTMLAAIGHGEAYAWLVSAEVLRDVASTGGKAAVTMQVLEEAKHFVVMRELIQAFEVPIRRQSVWEYLLLEQVLKADGLEKFFGMNVIVEGIALSIFGLLSTLPGLEVLKLFHLDESRHTALPANYFQEFPMTWWQKNNPRARWNRFAMVLPALGLLIDLEEPAAVMGYDVFDFGGSILRKVTFLADRVGFKGVLPYALLRSELNVVFNLYCLATRPEHRWKNYLAAETTQGADELAVEREVFGGVPATA